MKELFSKYYKKTDIVARILFMDIKELLQLRNSSWVLLVILPFFLVGAIFAAPSLYEKMSEKNQKQVQNLPRSPTTIERTSSSGFPPVIPLSEKRVPQLTIEGRKGQSYYGNSVIALSGLYAFSSVQPNLLGKKI